MFQGLSQQLAVSQTFSIEGSQSTDKKPLTKRRPIDTVDPRRLAHPAPGLYVHSTKSRVAYLASRLISRLRVGDVGVQCLNHLTNRSTSHQHTINRVYAAVVVRLSLPTPTSEPETSSRCSTTTISVYDFDDICLMYEVTRT